MRNAAAVPVIDILFEHLDAGRSWQTAARSVPATNYTDPGHLAQEREQLFGLRPQALALSADLPDVRTFVTRDTDRYPVVITRGDDGQARAFANVCAHRGAQVEGEDRGCKRRFTCPYHAWSYGLDGRLVTIPDGGAFDGVEVPGPGLPELPTSETNGVIWVNLDRDAPQPEPALGPIADDLAHYAITEHRHWRSYRFELELNWKLVVDTFLEPYHFAALHRNTVGPLFIPNLCHAERFGDHVREVLPRRTLTELRELPRSEWDIVPHSAMVYVLFPSTVFVMQMDHIETWRVIPDPNDPSRCVCDLDFYVPDEPETASAERHWQRNWQLTIDTVINEDFAAMAGVQRGLNSGLRDALRVGANEPALGQFHAVLADALSGSP